MKNLRQLFLIAALISAATGFSQDIEKRYPNGNLQYQFRHYDNCNCDSIKTFGEDGQLAYYSVSRYATDATGIPLKSITRYYADGVITDYIAFRDGLADGRWYSQYPNGKLLSESFYKGDWKTGTRRWFDTAGRLTPAHVYKDKINRMTDVNETATVRQYQDGKLVYTETLVQGKRTSLRVADQVRYKEVQKERRAVTGRQLFMANCMTCHLLKIDLTGPALNNIGTRRSEDWLIRYIQKGEAMRKRGDTAAIRLRRDWSDIEHPKFNLSHDEAKRIINYVNGKED